MTAELGDLKAHEVSTSEAEAEFERLLSDPRFRVTDRQREILRYLVQRRLEGQEESVKAYSIALDVLGRTSNFDAANDPIVRIEISRLRAALDGYYAAFGYERDASILVPKGRYLALFPKAVPSDQLHHTLVGAAASTGRHEEEAAKESDEPQKLDKVKIFVPLAAALMTIGATAFALNVLFPSSPVVTERPTVYLSMEAIEPGLAGDASQTRDMLLTTLTQFQTLTIAKAGATGVPGGSSYQDAYEIDIKYYGDEDDRSAWWQFVSRQSGDVLKSGVESIDTVGRSPAAIRKDMADMLARRFAATGGLINYIVMRETPANALGNACFTRAEFAFVEGGSNDLDEARQCLEQTLALSPKDQDANALLARSLVSPRGTTIDPQTAAKAIELARRAVSTNPFSDRANLALMTALFAAGRTDEAIQAGNRAVALNSNNTDAAATLAVVLYTSGYPEAGLAVAQDASRGVDNIPRDALLVMALDAYTRGRYSEASLLSEQVNYADFLVSALRTAALGQLDSHAAKVRMAENEGARHDFEGRFREKVAAAGIRPALQADIEAGLSKAGADFTSVSQIVKP